jgi:uncharacterized protein YcfL
MKRFNFKIYLLFLFVASLIISSCGSQKKVISNSEKSIGTPNLVEIGKLLLENIELSMTSVLALEHEGKVSMNLYEKYIEVSFKNGGVYLNRKFDNKSYVVQAMDVGIGRYSNDVKGVWKVHNKSPKLQLNSKIASTKDTLTITDTKFYIY